MILARELGQARLTGDQERINKAQVEHDAYRDICLQSDEMIVSSRRILDNDR